MTHTETKQKAQDQLMGSLMNAFFVAADTGENETIIKEISKQVERIEKLFGYVPKSWAR